jgi:hypothetical protein
MKESLVNRLGIAGRRVGLTMAVDWGARAAVCRRDVLPNCDDVSRGYSGPPARRVKADQMRDGALSKANDMAGNVGLGRYISGALGAGYRKPRGDRASFMVKPWGSTVLDARRSERRPIDQRARRRPRGGAFCSCVAVSVFLPLNATMREPL